MNKYLCICYANKWMNRQDNRLVVEASTSYAAWEKAVLHFRLTKNSRHQVSVNLVEKDGKEVVHTPDF